MRSARQSSASVDSHVQQAVEYPAMMVVTDSRSGVDVATVGVLAQFEFKPGNEEFAEQFFTDGKLLVEHQPATTMWFAFQLAPNEYGAFAAFANEADRDALLAAGGPKLAAENRARFSQPPTFEKVDILATRLAGAPGQLSC
jgi:hypothetical protein